MFADLCDRDGDDLPPWRTSADRCHRHTCLPLQKTNQGDTNVSDDELDDDDGDKSDGDGDVVGDQSNFPAWFHPSRASQSHNNSLMIMIMTLTMLLRMIINGMMMWKISLLCSFSFVNK